MHVVVAHALINQAREAIYQLLPPGKVQGINAHLLVVPRVVTLVQLVTTTILRADGVPDQLEQLDAIFG